MGINLPDELIFMKNSRAKQSTTNERVDGKLCVITGATSGVGLETIKNLAKGGANLVMIARNSKKAEKIKEELEKEYKSKVEVFIADLFSLNDVKKVGLTIKEKYPKIDILINCAGMHSTKKTYTKEGIERVLCVNHLASFLLTEILMDNVKNSEEGRIIQVNSEGHRFNGLDLNDFNWEKRIYTGLRGYGASKTAQLLTLWEMADSLKGTSVTINAVHPGEVKSNIGNNNGWLYRGFSKYFTSLFLKDAKISGEAIYYLAAASKMKGVSGKFFNLTIEEKAAKHVLDREASKVVLKLTRDLIEEKIGDFKGEENEV